MSIYLVRPEEILYLLQTAGVTRPATMTVVDFGMAEGTQPLAPEKDLAALQALSSVLAGPEVVARVWRQGAESEDQLAVWYYWSGDSAVKLLQTESGAFELSTLAGEEELLGDIVSLLPLRAVSATEDFFAVVNRQDFLEVRDLADVWAEVPALEILEADGLEKSSAKELFDVAAEPEWRAQVNFSGLQGDGNLERVLRVAQGAESAWMAQPLDENITRIRLETVQASELADLLQTYWDDVS